MFSTLLNIMGYCGIFCAIDKTLERFRLNGAYYLIHSIHNMAIVSYTANEVVQTLTNFSSIRQSPVNYTALQLCFALHIYHIALYWRKFRMDDWLHHGLMIGVALPIGGCLPAGTLLGYSLFFTTGLPGMIDYFILFLVRNEWANKDVEKRVNAWLNVWIRSPGCVSQAALTCAYLSTLQAISPVFMYGAYISAFLNYWNGQYFMRQIVYDVGTRQI
jgi:hypothetical protein